MAKGRLKASTKNRSETIFEVHLWPSTDQMPRTCCSRCAEKEPVPTLSPTWAKPDDKKEIGARLAATPPGTTSGKEKGRVLYLFDRAPLKDEQRVVGVALLSLEKRRLIRLYRLCFNEDVVSHERSQASVDLVNTARDLADNASGRLQMLVPPNGAAGELCKAYGFTETVKDSYGRTWMR